MVTSKRDSSAACPGASRKDKSARHSARNDDAHRNVEADDAQVAKQSAGHSMLCRYERKSQLGDPSAAQDEAAFPVMRVTSLRDMRHFWSGEFGAG